MRTRSLLSCSFTMLAMTVGTAHAAPWVPCAPLSSINPLNCDIASRPSSTFEYAIAYNTREPLPIVCTFWNLGARITNKQPYLVFSDNPAANLLWGGFVFYEHRCPGRRCLRRRLSASLLVSVHQQRDHDRQH